MAGSCAWTRRRNSWRASRIRSSSRPSGCRTSAASIGSLSTSTPSARAGGIWCCHIRRVCRRTDFSCQITATSEAEGHKLHGFVIAASSKRTMMCPIASSSGKEAVGDPIADALCRHRRAGGKSEHAPSPRLALLCRHCREPRADLFEFDDRFRTASPRPADRPANVGQADQRCDDSQREHPHAHQSTAVSRVTRRVEFFTAELDKQPDLNQENSR